MANQNTPEKIKEKFIKYVSLNVLGMLGLSCYILIDTLMVARGVGANGLAALNLAIPIYSFVYGTGLMIGMGGATRYAISKSKTVLTQSIFVASIFAVLFMALGVFLANQISHLLGADVVIHGMTKEYLQVILCFAPMFMFNSIFICFVRNDGNPKLAMTAMLMGSLANAIMDYIFIFPLDMGMFGAALATGIAPIISIGVLSLHIITKRNNFRVQKIKPQLKSWLDICSLGISALIVEFSSGVVIIVFNYLILRLEGNLGIAAYGVIANVALVIVAIFTGIAQGMQPIVSKNYGRGEHKATRQVLRYGLTLAVVLGLVIYLICTVFAVPIVDIFNKEQSDKLAEIAVSGMYIYFTSIIFVGINIISAAYLSAVDKPKQAFIIALLRGFILIVPIAFLLSNLLGMTGVWLACTCTELLVLFISIAMLKRKIPKS